jgi:hypothetical protein
MKDSSRLKRAFLNLLYSVNVEEKIVGLAAAWFDELVAYADFETNAATVRILAELVEEGEVDIAGVLVSLYMDGVEDFSTMWEELNSQEL